MDSVVDSPKDKLTCPYCAEDLNVEGGLGGFQTVVKCASCTKPFGVLATPITTLKFQTTMILED